jgi:hypothetical protein
VSTRKKKADGDSIRAAFGADHRAHLLDEYFEQQRGSRVDTANAWEHVYRLLLWADATTGLAHCYESDKCQPGKPWYERSLAFHDWVSSSLRIAPSELGDDIDWLFRRASTDLANEVARNAVGLARKAAKQRDAYERRDFPKPGQDHELVAIVRDVLGPHFKTEPTVDQWEQLVQRVHRHLALENKRKNLVGEGFEDVLAQVVRRTSDGAEIEVYARTPLHKVPGFRRASESEKVHKVDLAVIRPATQARMLVTVKWSVRADREKQFTTDYANYVKAEHAQRPWQYVFVTNEFDPARLMRACDQIEGNNRLFTSVVHINPAGIRSTYGPAKEPSMRRVIDLIDEGRLISLQRWLDSFVA